MDERTADKIIAATYWPRTGAAFALGFLALFLVIGAVGELKSLAYIGSGIAATNTITVTGEGISYAIPDVAEFSVTVQDTAQDVTSAQTAATTKGNAIITYLEGAGVANTDIQTTDYEIDPQYQYNRAICPQVLSAGGSNASVAYCPSNQQVLTGYQVSETLSVKVLDTSKAGTLLAGVGSKGASQVSGLSFTVSDETAVQSGARNKAITDAKTKAAALAKSLGVSLVRIVSYSENGSPVYYPQATSGMAMDASAAPAPAIPTGQNKITSDVSITYEIQ